MEATKDPLSEERNWMMRRRAMGRRSRPTGLSSSAMKSVNASPWSPSNVGNTITRTTTTARMTACGGPARRSSIIADFGCFLV